MGLFPDFKIKDGELVKYKGKGGEVVIPDGVTSIGPWAFEDCTSLTSVTIPESVTAIKEYAFWGCASLASVTIPDGVTSIEKGAFYGCSAFTSVTIPESVTAIKEYAFCGCTSLTSVTIPTRFADKLGDIFGKELAKKEIFTFVNGATLTSEFEIVDGRLVKYKGKGGKVVIPDGVTSIGSWAFERCTSLTSVTIPEGVAIIERGAFHDCTSLTSVTIPVSVTSIGESAFFECVMLTVVTIPKSVTAIKDYAFCGCTSLTSVTIPPQFRGRRANIFGEEIAKKNIFTFTDEEGVAPAPMPVTFPPEFQVEDGVLLAYLGNEGEVHIPEGVTAIDGEAFTSEARVTAVYISASVTEIEEATFADLPYLAAIRVDEANPAYCSVNGALYTKDMSVLLQYPVANRNTSYTAPEGLLRVGKGAFYYCRELHYVNLGGVTEIGDYAFCGCLHLFSLTATAEEIEVGEGAFAECQKLERVDAPALLAKKDSIFPDSRV